MLSPPHKVRPEKAADSVAVETLIQTVFGPGAWTRAAYALREGIPHNSALAFVAEVGGILVGSVRFTPVIWGGVEVLMLGPLGVVRHHAKQGIGRALVSTGMDAAHKARATNGHDVVILVGDLAYYGPLGFTRILPGKIHLPRPADPARILGCELKSDALDGLAGNVERCLR